MNQEEKQLLLIDFCARLPFGICANLPNHHLVSHKYVIQDIDIQNGWTVGLLDSAGRIRIYSAKVEDIRPYLRPMNSMTEEEKRYIDNRWGADNYGDIITYSSYENGVSTVELSDIIGFQDWLNANHFDYRGLIPKGLAIEAPEGMYNSKTE